MAETLSTLSVASFIIAVISFALAVFLWFLFRIPYVIGDLSGRTAKKSIDKMRLENAGKKTVKVRSLSEEEAKITGKLNKIANEQKQNDVSKQDETSPLYEDETKPLDYEATELLVGEDTELLTASSETELVEEQEKENVSLNNDGIKLKIIEEIIFTSTDEVI